jgi:predicted NAD/FAD-dependent oxidoreductase
MAGLTAARVLVEGGWSVTVVDKGRGVGGRMATRRIGDARFDHGAQFFTVRDTRFREQVDRWIAQGWVAPWYEDGGHVRYRSEGGMSGLAKQLAGGLDVRVGVPVVSIALIDGIWHGSAGDGAAFEADALLMTAPPKQSLAVLAACLGRIEAPVVEELRAVEFDPCFALMVHGAGDSRVPEPGYVRPEQGPIDWIADNRRKGVSGGGGSALTIHASGEFSRRRFDAPQDEVARELLAAAEPWIGGSVEDWQIHRWKFAKPVSGTWPGCLFSASPAPVAFAGDGLAGGKVEGAFLSGLQAAEKLMENCTPVGRGHV